MNPCVVSGVEEPSGATSIAGGCPPDASVVDAVPKGEVHSVLLVHIERRVQRVQNLVGLGEVYSRERPRAQHVHRRNRQQRRPDPVPANVEQVDCEFVGVYPVVAEAVAAKLRGAFEDPVGVKVGGVDFRGEQADDVVFRLVQLAWLSCSLRIASLRSHRML